MDTLGSSISYYRILHSTMPCHHHPSPLFLSPNVLLSRPCVPSYDFKFCLIFLFFFLNNFLPSASSKLLFFCNLKKKLKQVWPSSWKIFNFNEELKVGRKMASVGGEELMHCPSICEEKIVVSVRLRPLNEQEISRNDVSYWECINSHTIIITNNLMAPERSIYPTAFTFDLVFRCECSTRKVYGEAARDVALSVVSGINSSIFAYGQTSSGKTFTMSSITESIP